MKKCTRCQEYIGRCPHCHRRLEKGIESNPIHRQIPVDRPVDPKK